MRILITAFFDDNFGDMLIRTCFTQLLRTALEELGFEGRDHIIDTMPLKEADEKKITDADVLFFAGGGLFGLSYLNFSESLKRILDIAEASGTAVVFSSLGANNMDAGEEDTDELRSFFERNCIKAVSVRENPDMFRRYAEGTDLDIIPVCDPAVWAGHVYHESAKKYKSAGSVKPLVGINFVRGGLFRANDTDWNMEKEEELLYGLAGRLEEQGIDCRFFTNGSAMDCAAMLQFAEDYSIPKDKYILCDTARDLVRTTAQFDAVVATRMHSSIVSYALDVPSLNMVWNPKIPFFYENIAYPDRALMPDDWSVDNLVKKVNDLLADSDYSRDSEYMMSLYRFIAGTVGELLDQAKETDIYDYETVCQKLSEMEVPAEEDISDMRFKLLRAETQYNKLKKSKANQKAELKEEIRSRNKELKALKKENEKLARKNEKLSEKYDKVRAERNALKRRLERIDNKPIVRLYHKIRGIRR